MKRAWLEVLALMTAILFAKRTMGNPTTPTTHAATNATDDWRVQPVDALDEDLKEIFSAKLRLGHDFDLIRFNMSMSPWPAGLLFGLAIPITLTPADDTPLPVYISWQTDPLGYVFVSTGYGLSAHVYRSVNTSQKSLGPTSVAMAIDRRDDIYHPVLRIALNDSVSLGDWGIDTMIDWLPAYTSVREARFASISEKNRRYAVVVALMGVTRDECASLERGNFTLDIDFGVYSGSTMAASEASDYKDGICAPYWASNANRTIRVESLYSMLSRSEEGIEGIERLLKKII